MIPAIILSLFKPIIDIVSSVASILASLFKVISPVMEGIASFIVWYVKTFFTGLGVVFRNLSTLAVLGTFVFATGSFVKLKEAKDCREEVQLQRDYDARKYGELLKAQVRPVAPNKPKRPAKPVPKVFRY